MTQTHCIQVSSKWFILPTRTPLFKTLVARTTDNNVDCYQVLTAVVARGRVTTRWCCWFCFVVREQARQAILPLFSSQVVFQHTYLLFSRINVLNIRTSALFLSLSFFFSIVSSFPLPCSPAGVDPPAQAKFQNLPAKKGPIFIYYGNPHNCLRSEHTKHKQPECAADEHTRTYTLASYAVGLRGRLYGGCD